MHRILVRKNNSAILLEHKSTSSIPSSLTDISYHRLVVIILFLALSYLALCGRLINIVFFQANSINAGSLIAHNNIQTSRKEIVDRNGNILATNLQIASLNIRPSEVFDKPRCAKMLSSIFPDIKEDEMLNKLYSGKKYLRLKNSISPEEQNQVNYIGEPGLVFEYVNRRVYPQGNLFAHLVGYVDLDGRGVAGIEKYFDDLILKNHNPNEKLVLSIDASVQAVVKEELSKSLEHFSAKAALGIVMDTNNGEVLAMVSLPDYNPNNPGQSPAGNLYNKVTHGVYELGSIFKVVTFAIAVDSGKIYLKDIYNVSNKLQVSKFKIGDYKKYADWLSIPEIFMYSSNIGTGKISLDVGKDLQQKYYKKFGLLDTIDIELPERGAPLYPARYNWTDVNMVTMSYGHGIAITPLHLATLNNAVVNGGYLYKPTLVKIKDSDTVQAEKILKDETSDYMRRLYRLTVEKGTGKNAEAQGYMLGGKTGSAEKVQGRGYHKSEKLSSFVGSFPMHDPKYTVLVLLDAPKTINNLSSTGGIAAAPIAKNIVQRIGPILNVQPVPADQVDAIYEQLFIESSPETESYQGF
jgi:cell division protein FtsI (penicillin-binding protein 3)